MGFDFGAFAGGMAQTGLDTYVKLKEQQRLRDEHEYMQKQRALQTALQDKLQASPKVGDANPNAEQTGGIPLSELAANNPGMFDPKAVQAGQYVQFNQAAPPPDAATPAAALPTGTSAPQAQPRYFAYADPRSGQMYATDKPVTYDQDAVAMHQADVMVSSGLPDFVARGQEMRNNVVQNRLVREQIQKYQYENSAAEAQRAVSSAGMLFQQGDMANGLKTLSSAYNTHVPGPYKLQAEAVQGQPDMIRMVHTDAAGSPMFIEKPRPWKTIIAEASAMATPGGFADYLQKAQTLEQQATELAARSKVWNLQAEQIQAAIDAGAPEAEVDKMKAEAEAARSAQGASDEYKNALAAESREKAELNKQIRGLNEQMLRETNPERLAVLTAQRAALEGKVQTTQFYQTLSGDLVRNSPITGKTELFSSALKMFLPLGLDGNYIAGLPEIKKGNVQFVVTPDGQVGYRSKNMSPTQMATTYEEAVDFMKNGQTPTSALPAD